MYKRPYFRIFVLIFFLSGVYVFVFGESGILERIILQKKKVQLQSRIESLKAKERQLTELLKEYSGGRLTDDDLLHSGFLPPDKRVLVLKGLGGDKLPVQPETRSPSAGPFQTQHLRILWVVVSMLIMLFYFTKREKENEGHDGN